MWTDLSVDTGLPSVRYFVAGGKSSNSHGDSFGGEWSASGGIVTFHYRFDGDSSTHYLWWLATT